VCVSLASVSVSVLNPPQSLLAGPFHATPTYLPIYLPACLPAYHTWHIPIKVLMFEILAADRPTAHPILFLAWFQLFSCSIRIWAGLATQDSLRFRSRAFPFAGRELSLGSREAPLSRGTFGPRLGHTFRESNRRHPPRTFWSWGPVLPPLPLLLLHHPSSQNQTRCNQEKA